MKKYLCLIGVLGVLLCNTANSYAQKVAVKTNLLYDATTTMNLGLEIGLGKKWSLDLSGNYNPTVTSGCSAAAGVWRLCLESAMRGWTTPNIPVPHAAPFRKVRRKTTSARQRLP